MPTQIWPKLNRTESLAKGSILCPLWMQIFEHRPPLLCITRLRCGWWLHEDQKHDIKKVDATSPSGSAGAQDILCPLNGSPMRHKTENLLSRLSGKTPFWGVYRTSTRPVVSSKVVWEPIFKGLNKLLGILLLIVWDWNEPPFTLAKPLKSSYACFSEFLHVAIEPQKLWCCPPALSARFSHCWFSFTERNTTTCQNAIVPKKAFAPTRGFCES